MTPGVPGRKFGFAAGSLSPSKFVPPLDSNRRSARRRVRRSSGFFHGCSKKCEIRLKGCRSGVSENRPEIAINASLPVGDLGYDSLRQFRFQLDPKQHVVIFEPLFEGKEFSVAISRSKPVSQ
jgi:hypothetical protein